jgi:hypothetical protein
VRSRTSGAEALNCAVLYGTAEAVPFVKRLFPRPVKSCPDTKRGILEL